MDPTFFSRSYGLETEASRPGAINDRTKAIRWSVSLLLGVFGLSAACFAWAEEEILVGRSAAGRIKVDVGFSRLGLEASVFPGITGYATGEVGFHSTVFDEPGNDFFQVSPAADFRFVLLAKDAGMEVWNDTGSGFMAVGESFFIGQAPFDNHPVWNIVSGTPGTSYSLTLKVLDLNGIYTESEPFELSFTPMPPVLTISNATPGFVTISWTPNTRGFMLQATTALTPAAWSNAPSGPTNPITVPAFSPMGFYRLSK